MLATAGFGLGGAAGPIDRPIFHHAADYTGRVAHTIPCLAPRPGREVTIGWAGKVLNAAHKVLLRRAFATPARRAIAPATTACRQPAATCSSRCATSTR